MGPVLSFGGLDGGDLRRRYVYLSSNARKSSSICKMKLKFSWILGRVDEA